MSSYLTNFLYVAFWLSEISRSSSKTSFGNVKTIGLVIECLTSGLAEKIVAGCTPIYKSLNATGIFASLPSNKSG